MRKSKYCGCVIAALAMGMSLGAYAETPIPEQTKGGTLIWPAPRTDAPTAGGKDGIIWNDATPAATSPREVPAKNAGVPDHNGIIWNDPPGRVSAQAPTPPIRGVEECREFDADVTIEGHRQPMHGTACRQPDGRWRVVSQAPQ